MAMNETLKTFETFSITENGLKKMWRIDDPKSFFEWLTFKRSLDDLIDCLKFKDISFCIKIEKDDGTVYYKKSEELNNYDLNIKLRL